MKRVSESTVRRIKAEMVQDAVDADLHPASVADYDAAVKRCDDLLAWVAHIRERNA